LIERDIYSFVKKKRKKKGALKQKMSGLSSDGKKRLSGHQYKKLRQEKEQREEENLKKNLRIDSFFTRTQPTPSEGVSDRDEPDADGNQPQARPSCSRDRDPFGASVTADEPEAEAKPGIRQLLSVDLDCTNVRSNFDLNDPGTWIPNNLLGVISDAIIDLIVKNLPHQDLENVDFTSFERIYKDGTRKLTKSMFFAELHNGTKVKREWLRTSSTLKKVFCVPCTLFCRHGNRLQLSYFGFNDWKNASAGLGAHERSIEHRDCTVALIKRQSQSATGIGRQMKEQYEQEKCYWRAVLKRNIAAIQFLSARGLPFRGHNSELGSTHNGNYLGILELIGKFDDFMASHLTKYGNRGRGHVSYLSHTICDELILLIATEVRKYIIAEIHEAKYYSIIVDSNPDVSHVDQLSVLFRFVNKKGEPVERFLCFIPIGGHSGSDLEDTVLKVLEDGGITLKNCRGQCYDNASNMSGVYKGLQARIIRGGSKEQEPPANPEAVFIPCMNHSLNLVGTSAAECCLLAIKYFMFLQKLYTFFSASTHRWALIKKFIEKDKKAKKSGIDNTEISDEGDGTEGSRSNDTTYRYMPKDLSKTRWSAKHMASRALITSREPFQNTLKELSENKLQENEVRLLAASLLKKLSDCEIVFMSVFWDTILERMDAVNVSLQAVDIDLGKAVDLYASLINYFEVMRNERFEEFFEKARQLLGAATWDESVQSESAKRPKKRKLAFDENRDNETIFTFKEKLKFECFNVVLDKVISEMQSRKKAYGEIHNLFSFLLNIKNSEREVIRDGVKTLINFYKSDFNIDISQINDIIEEFLHFKEQSLHLTRPKEMLQYIIENEMVSTYPNVFTALLIFLTIPVSNASSGRSFSVLKRIKNYLRSTLRDDKLTALALLSIENELMYLLDIDDVIDKFAHAKSRKKVM